MTYTADGTQPTVADFAVAAVEAGVIPELSPWQVAYLEALDGDRTLTHAPAYVAQRAGRRYLRAILAAYFILAGEPVAFVGADPERARQDALEIVQAIQTTERTLA